jgi:hypothetical protein
LLTTARDTIWGQRTDAGYAFLDGEVGQYDVMMADLTTGWVAASFGGKLVSVQHPLAFVSQAEQQARRTAVKAFFDPATSQADRERLLSRYQVSYVLAPRRSELDSSVVAEHLLRELGAVTHEDDRVLLVRLNSRPDRAAPMIAAPQSR